MANKRALLRKLREQKGTQAEVAADIGISTVYLRMIENGTFTPGRDLMFKFSTYFGEPPEKLFPDYFERTSVSV
ncbi:helix-turn-helix transcriptional regulator [Paenibacillus naphthalenovorans]|uniref:helix-turn-helix transcriptional regulator n=1 Tax=Paenibacillus naphthalenovorans TaxID=162209 RepID=UPI003D2BA766